MGGRREREEGDYVEIDKNSSVGEEREDREEDRGRRGRIGRRVGVMRGRVGRRLGGGDGG